MHWQRPASLGISVLFIAFGSCFEAPIREDLRLRFLPNGAVVATSTVRITDPEGGNPALARRLDEARRTLQEGSDPWGARFAAASPGAERFSWEKRLGTLSSASRSALITEPEGLEAFFQDTSLAVSYTLDPGRGIAELSIVPGPSNRATRRQREEMEKTLDVWTGDVAEYLQATQDLYAYLDEKPDRARPCFGALFAERLSEKEAKSLSPLTPDEKRKLDRLDAALRKVVDVLAVPEGAAYSPDEISHLVYDPFPARLSLKLPAAPQALEGFLTAEDGSLSVQGRGLWEALRSLEGRWLAPDPVLFYVESAQREGEGALDLDVFLAKPRHSTSAHLLPSGHEVRAEVVSRLKPAPLYRVAWRVNVDDETPFRWEEGEGR
ncbi:MAG TPA: hypothetical protein VGM86_13740 [Thermoanaerobaculia bacterium]|jgi:hypothetical protein